MNASPDQQRLRISSPTGLLAVVPHVLGLTPSPAWSCSASRRRPAGSGSACATTCPTRPTQRTGPIVSGYSKTKCVDDSNDSSANGTKIVIGDCNGSAGQNWAIEPDGTIRINGKCMDIYREQKPARPRRPVGMHRPRQPAMAATQRHPGQPGLRQMPRRPGIRHQPTAPSWRSTPATAAPTSNGNCPDPARQLRSDPLIPVEADSQQAIAILKSAGTTCACTIPYLSTSPPSVRCPARLPLASHCDAWSQPSRWSCRTVVGAPGPQRGNQQAKIGRGLHAVGQFSSRSPRWSAMR